MLGLMVGQLLVPKTCATKLVQIVTPIITVKTLTSGVFWGQSTQLLLELGI